MASFYLTQQAKKDLLEIFVYLSEQSDVETAEAFLRKLGINFEMVAASPKAFPLRPELRSNVRSYPFKRYMIFYQEVASGVEILRVLHSARDIESIFDQPRNIPN